MLELKRMLCTTYQSILQTFKYFVSKFGFLIRTINVKQIGYHSVDQRIMI